MKRAWHILSGEYPPCPGGVSDYAHVVATELAARGERVHVWAPGGGGGLADPGVSLHPLPGRFGPAALAELERGLSRDPEPKRLFVQYVPHAFGMKAMNAPLCAWLAARRRERVWIMFHEVAFPFRRRQALRYNLLAGVTSAMAALVARRADEAFVSTRAWTPLLERLGCRAPIHGLPIPSTLPSIADPVRVAAVRQALLGGAPGTVLGHFGTFGGAIAGLLAPPLASFLAGGEGGFARRVLLLGRGSVRFAASFAAEHRALSGLVAAREDLSPEDAAAHLGASDILLQPFPDGATTRRTSLMAGLALGRAVVTNDGQLCEAIWREGAVALVASPDPAALAAQVERLAAAPSERATLAERARALYEARFSRARTVEALLALARAEDARGDAPRRSAVEAS